ncbi:MAG: molybdopterin biosynthesis protein MoeB [bacterium ADurb.Bin374]|nr:MAG: molybdopterin biosynthesis protein MoeB [bacterium ADurb.Bin374]
MLGKVISMFMSLFGGVDGVERISVRELEKRISEGLSPDELVIDVREPDEFASGHVPGAENIPLGIVSRSADRVKGRKRLFVICLSGGRSMQACGQLAGRLDGTTTLVNVDGGTMAWIGAGFKVEKN